MNNPFDDMEEERPPQANPFDGMEEEKPQTNPFDDMEEATPYNVAIAETQAKQARPRGFADIVSNYIESRVAGAGAALGDAYQKGVDTKPPEAMKAEEIAQERFNRASADAPALVKSLLTGERVDETGTALPEDRGWYRRYLEGNPASEFVKDSYLDARLALPGFDPDSNPDDRAQYEAITRHRWVGPEKLARMPPDIARAVKARQTSGPIAMAQEGADMFKAIATLPVMAAQEVGKAGAAAEAAPEGEGWSAARDSLGVPLMNVGTELVMSPLRTASSIRRGEGLPRESPLGSALDVLGGAGAVGAGIKGARAAKAARAGGASRASAAATGLLEAGIDQVLPVRSGRQQNPALDPVARLVEEEMPLTRARSSGTAAEIVEDLKTRQFDAARREYEAQGMAQDLRRALDENPDEALTSQVALETGVTQAPRNRELIQAQRRLERLLTDDVENPVAKPILDELDRQGVPVGDMRTALEALRRKEIDATEYAEMRAPYDRALTRALDDAENVEQFAEMLTPEAAQAAKRARRLEAEAGQMQRVADEAANQARRAEDIETTAGRRVEEQRRKYEEAQEAAEARAIRRQDEERDRAERGVARADEAISGAQAKAQSARRAQRFQPEDVDAAAVKAEARAERRIGRIEKDADITDRVTGPEINAGIGRFVDDVGDAVDFSDPRVLDVFSEQTGRVPRTIGEGINDVINMVRAGRPRTGAHVAEALEIVSDAPGFERVASYFDDVLSRSELRRYAGDEARRIAAEEAPRIRAEEDAKPLAIAKQNEAGIADAKKGRVQERDALRQEGAAKARGVEAARRLKQAEKPAEVNLSPAAQRKGQKLARLEAEREGRARDTKKAKQKADAAEKTAREIEAKAKEAVPQLPERSAVSLLERDIKEFRRYAEESGVPASKAGVLKLDGEPLASSQSALSGKPLENLAKAAEEGRLRFESPNKAVEQLLNERVLPWAIHRQAQDAELLRHGIITEETAKANSASHVQNIYNEDIKRSVEVDHANRELSMAAEQALKSGSKEDLDAYNALARETAKKFKAKRQSGLVFGPMGSINTGSLKQAFVKYVASLDEQIARGRYGPEFLPEVLEKQALDKIRIISTFDFYEDVARKVARDEVPLGAKPLKKPVDVGSIGRRQSLAGLRVDGETWVLLDVPGKVGGAPKLGKLQGKWVKKADADFILDASNHIKSSPYARRILNAWKSQKVPHNFASHVNMLAGNIINQAFVDGVGYMRGVADLNKSERAIARWFKSGEPDPVTDAFFRAGGRYNASPAAMLDTTETAGIFKGTKGLTPKQRAESILERAKDDPRDAAVALFESYANLSGGFGRMSHLFERAELASRRAIFERFIQREAKSTGRPVAQLLKDEAVTSKAVKHAIRIQLDYSDLPRWARRLRQNPIVGMPFISYAVKAAPMLAGAVVRRPFRSQFARAAGESNYDSQAKEDRAAMDRVADYMRGQTLVAVPKKVRDYAKTQLGDDLAKSFMLDKNWTINASYLNPFPLPKGGSEDTPAREIVPMQAFGGPMTPLLEIGINRSLFYNRPIMDKNDTLVEQAVAAGLYLAGSMSSGTMHQLMEKVIIPKATGSDLDLRGRKTTPILGLIRAAGIKLTEDDERKALKRLRFALNAAKTADRKERKKVEQLLEKAATVTSEKRKLEIQAQIAVLRNRAAEKRRAAIMRFHRYRVPPRR